MTSEEGDSVVDAVRGTLEDAFDAISVRRVFGEAYGVDGVTIIPAARVFGGGGGGGGGGAAGGIDLGEQAAGAQGSISVANPRNSRTSPIEGMSEEQIAERTPDDIMVIADDDIIARQLREAALAEDDPELRDRLWAEYRKYKGI